MANETKAQIVAELARAEYVALSHRDAALLYNSKTISSIRKLGGAEIARVITAAELSGFADKSLLPLLLSYDDIDLGDSGVVDKLAALLGAEIVARAQLVATVSIPAFSPITTYDVMVARGAA